IYKAVARGKKGLYLGPTKNGKPRKIKLDDESIQLLKKWKKEQAEVLLKLGFNTQKQNQLVFPNMDNNLEEHNKTYEWLKGILDKYNLEYVNNYGLPDTHTSNIFECDAHIVYD